jgi:hypothetical protein
MPDLTPIPASDVDPRIAPHLETGEEVLWQGAPRQGTFLRPGIVLVLGVAVAFGVLAPLGALDAYLFVPGEPLSPERLLTGGIAVAAGLGLGAKLWTERDSLWAYAITDRRLLSVKGPRLHRAVGPEDIRGFGKWRDAAYWKHVAADSRDRGRDREKRFPGFHGLADAEDMLRTFQDWRERFSRKASAEAASFVAARPEADADAATAADVPEGARRIRHPGIGLTIDVPAGWEATISRDEEGPLRIFGVTVMQRFIRQGEKRPYADGADWTALTVRGAPECGLDLRIVPAPLTKTLEGVIEDPWAKVAGLEVLKTQPDLELDGFRGFSLVRTGKAGAKAKGMGEARGPVAMRQAWLGRGDMHLEIKGLARVDQPDVQRAVDAMIDSLRIA